MVEKLAFALYRYSLLGIFAIAIYGLGRPMTGWFTQSLRLSKFLTVPLTLAGGMGIAMITLFIAGILGYLNVTVIALLILVGLGSVIASMVTGTPGCRVSTLTFSYRLPNRNGKVRGRSEDPSPR